MQSVSIIYSFICVSVTAYIEFTSEYSMQINKCYYVLSIAIVEVDIMYY